MTNLPNLWLKFSALACVLILLGQNSSYGAQIYFSDIVTLDGRSAVLRRANGDGTESKTLATGLNSPRSVALDVGTGKVYWVELGARSIRRISLDGGWQPEDVVSIGDASGGLALDLAAGKIYWASGTGAPLGGVENAVIRRANLDGNMQEDLVTTGLSNPQGVALDLRQNKLYWTDLEGHRDGAGSIKRANMDGSGVETLLSGIDEATGLALDVEEGKMYWSEAETGKIQRANLDGTGLTDLVIGLDNPTTISLDLAERRMYWTDSEWDGQVNRISRANFDGTGAELVLTSSGFPYGIAVARGPQVDLVKAVKPNFRHLETGQRYQLELSRNLVEWSSHGTPFTATGTTMAYPEYWDVDNWHTLYFRLQLVP